MQHEHIIIIGAGAAGLMAARSLAKAGQQVTILEGRNRTGGRIFTLKDESFSLPVETGAEFIHGELPLTLRLLEEAGIGIIPMQGAFMRSVNGAVSSMNEFFEDWTTLEQKFNSLKTDLTVADFLTLHFPDPKYASLRASIRGYAEGYDAADLDKASTFALRAEWMGGEAGTNYRIEGGYGMMISLLEQQCKMAGVNILLNCRAKEINWQRNSVRVLCADGNVINGNKTVITAPIGILQLPKDDEYFLAFNPPLIRKTDAIAGMGYGAAIKVMILFETAFWKNAVWKKQTGNVAEELGFIISDAEIPTWWTQHPLQNNLLTGWLGGPSARKARDWSDADFLNKALQSLADIFQESITQLKEKISAWHIANWSADPYARGAYTYATLHTAAGVSVLENPESDTIFFAGEGIYDGKAKGTVEAALASAETVVSKILGV